MCIYLLRMREFYRWKNSIPPGVTIDTDILGSWVHSTESYWDTIEDNDFLPITIEAVDYQPFDVTRINAQLAQTNLVYSAGLGRMGQPHFMLAERVHPTTKGSTDHIICGNELARDSITLPALSQNGTIIIRRHSLMQMLWQMTEEWSIRKPPGAMARLVDRYALENTGELSHRLETAATDLSDLLLHHEIGELEAGKLLGEQYSQMTYAFSGNPGEAPIRAVRDLLADTLASWPFIVGNKSSHHLDFWLAGLNGIRQQLHRQTPLHSQLHSPLQRASPANRLAALTAGLETERSRWHYIATQLLETYQQHGTQFKVLQTVNNSLQTTL